MKMKIRKIFRIIGLFRFTLLIGITCTLGIIYIINKYENQIKDFYQHSEFKILLFIVLGIGWILFYICYLHKKFIKLNKQFINFAKDVIDKEILTDKKIEKLNRNTRMLMYDTTSNKKDGVA